MSLKQVAQKAGVSIATVSRVINNMGNVDPETVKLVNKVIKDLNYKPSRVAQQLRNTNIKSKFIGLILPDIQNPFYIDVIKGVEEYMYNKGYAVVVGNYSQDEKKAHLYIDIFKSESIAGYIIAPVPGSEKQIDKLMKAGNAVVCVDRGLENIDVDLVIVDNEKGAFQATEHLIKLGHKRIAHIAGSMNIPTTGLRINGYKKALELHNIKFKENLLLSKDSSKESGKALTRKLLSLKEPPTAILTGNNLITLGALEVIHEQNVKIPEEVSIVGFDDLPWANSLNPPLTAINQPAFEIGKMAGELLNQRISDMSRPKVQLELKTELIVRNSTDKL